MVSGAGVGEIALGVCGRLAIAGVLRIDVVGGCPFSARPFGACPFSARSFEWERSTRAMQ